MSSIYTPDTTPPRRAILSPTPSLLPSATRWCLFLLPLPALLGSFGFTPQSRARADSPTSSNPPSDNEVAESTPATDDEVKQESEEEPEPEPEPKKQAAKKKKSAPTKTKPRRKQVQIPDEDEETPPQQQLMQQQQQQMPQFPDGTTHTASLPPGKNNALKDNAMQPLQTRKKLLSEDIGEAMMAQMDEQRAAKKDEKQSLKINISLDLDVEVHLSARVKGDITIGLL